MPKNLIKKYLPDPEKIKAHKSLHFLGDVIHEPNLWHLNRHSVSRAFAIGLFWGSIPMPFQMVPAALCAIKFNGNFPISLALVWFSNPVTMPAIFYFEYLIGASILDIPVSSGDFHFSLNWLAEKFVEFGMPMYFGALVCGIILSITGFFGILWLWNRHIRKAWHKRRKARAERESSKES